jgi:hypothetical protein
MSFQVFSIDKSQIDTNKSPAEAFDDSERPYFVTLLPARMSAQVRGNSKEIAVNDANVGFEIYPKISEQFFCFGIKPLAFGNAIELRGKQASNITSYLRARPLLKDSNGNVLKDSNGNAVFGTGVVDQLKVYVPGEQRLTISFYNMLAPGKKPDWPILTRAQCEALVRGVNDIFQPQVNLSLNLQYLSYKILPGYGESVAVDIPNAWRANEKHLPKPLGVYDVAPKGSDQYWPCVNARRPGPLGCNVADPRVNLISDPLERKYTRELNLETALRQTPNWSDFDVYVFDKIEQNVKFPHAAWNLGRKCVVAHDVESRTLAHEIGHWLFNDAQDMKDPDTQEIEDSKGESKKPTGHHCNKPSNLMRGVPPINAKTDWQLTRYQILAARQLLLEYGVQN